MHEVDLDEHRRVALVALESELPSSIILNVILDIFQGVLTMSTYHYFMSCNDTEWLIMVLRARREIVTEEYKELFTFMFD